MKEKVKCSYKTSATPFWFRLENRRSAPSKGIECSPERVLLLKEFALSPNGPGKSCQWFRYDFFGNKLELSPHHHNKMVEIFDMEARRDATRKEDATWKLMFDAYYINQSTVEHPATVEFQLVQQTSLPVPKSFEDSWRSKTLKAGGIF
uniref:AlNc14C28G2719 protein n=1 Tax=Albugo laibachii Nc14 TaxID=890382 RepID=F0W797_9STRA|nr:AlNc14C28G2719 [Albugo laibachii Nc14]|eukprot:CCA16996.1 AlNc14C28G2719 [Albugo laibachii Nc14]